MPSEENGNRKRDADPEAARHAESSGFSSSDALTVRGSRAMPQIGHEPGSERTISGCIGQVYSIRAAEGLGTDGSRAMPHFGQAPGFCSRTSGSIGQM